MTCVFFLCNCMFSDERGGGLTGQPFGPLVDTATMTVMMSANRVDLGSFRSRCCAFRHTHTSADPIRLLCIRLALPLTLSLLSQFAPSERLTVGVPPRALWLARIFLRRKKTCAGIVGTRTDWVLKGEGGERTTPHSCSTLNRLTVETRFLGLDGEVTRRVGRGAPCLSDSRLWGRATSFTHVLEEDRSVHHFLRFRPHIFLRAERCN